MENASKALIIAGETLIAILILTLMVSMFLAFGNFSKNMEQRLQISQIQSFNGHFQILENRDNITAQEIVSVINFAKKANDDRQLDYNTRTSSEYYTTVTIDDKDVFNNSDYVKSASQYNDLGKILDKFLKENNAYLFSCEGTTVNENTGLVNNISFKKV